MLTNLIGDVNRWYEKAGLRRDEVRSQVIDVLKAQIKRRPAMKKIKHCVGKDDEQFLPTETDHRVGRKNYLP